MWKLVPEVDAIIPLPGSRLLSVVWLLRREPSLMWRSFSQIRVRAALESWLTRIPRKVGYRGHWRRWLLNQIVPVPRKPGPPEHHSLRFLRIARECGAAHPTSIQIAVQAFNIRRPTSRRPSTANRSKSVFARVPNTVPPNAGYPNGSPRSPKKSARNPPSNGFCLERRATPRFGDQIAATLGDHCVNRVGQTHARPTDRRAARMPFIAYERYWHDASRCIVGVPVVAIFGSTEPRLTEPTRQWSYGPATSCRMQPLLSSRMPD